MTDANVWQANLLRFSVFPQPDYEADDNWWEQVVGEIPESETLQPRNQQKQYKGIFNNGNLILTIQPTRIDWLYMVDMPNSLDSTLGNFSESTEIFIQLMSKWLDNININFVRIAFGAILHQPVENHKAGYDLLTNYLRFDPEFDENTSEFLFQINRRDSSENINEILLNRLMKWSVTKFETMTIMPVQRKLPSEFALRLELDINTHQEFDGEITSDNTQILLEEFIEIGHRISIVGDK